jgi:hypothetical protein
MAIPPSELEAVSTVALAEHVSARAGTRLASRIRKAQLAVPSVGVQTCRDSPRSGIVAEPVAGQA